MSGLYSEPRAVRVGDSSRAPEAARPVSTDGHSKMRGTHFPTSCPRYRPAGNARLCGNLPERRGGLALSVVFHAAALVAALLWSVLGQPSSPGVISVTLVKPSQAPRPSEKRVSVGDAPTTPATRAEAEPTLKWSPTVMWKGPGPTIGGAEDRNLVQRVYARLDHPSSMPPDARAEQAPQASNSDNEGWTHRSLWAAASSPQGSSESLALVQDEGQGSLAPAVTRRFDWQANAVEEDETIYSAPGNPSKLTVRQAYSDGFRGTSIAPGVETNSEANSNFFGLTSRDGTATSQRLDLTLVDHGNLGVTAFGYQNEVGRDFRPFGEAKKEFSVVGSTTVKAGGEVRLGALGIGFAQSSIQSLENVAGSSALQQEASVTLDLPSLLSDSRIGLASSLVPTLWATRSVKWEEADASGTLSTSLGGSWTWSNGYATVGYWNYSSYGSDTPSATTWAGQGFDANLGGYYSSFSVDLNLSYGHSEDAVATWQSAGILYDSSLTLSYKPENVPGIWATVAAGNFDYNGLLMGARGTVEPSLDFETSTKSEYWSISAGVDLSELFWNDETSMLRDSDKQQSFVKLLLRYNNDLYLESAAAEPTRSADVLVAIMAQHTF
jgi:hypothetical protein